MSGGHLTVVNGPANHAETGAKNTGFNPHREGGFMNHPRRMPVRGPFSQRRVSKSPALCRVRWVARRDHHATPSSPTTVTGARRENARLMASAAWAAPRLSLSVILLLWTQ